MAKRSSAPKRRGQENKPAGFFGTLQKSKKDAAKRWNEAKKAKDQFKTPDIPSGVYMSRLSNITQGETSNNKAPYIAFQFTVIRHPEWKGTPLSILHTVEEKKKKDGEVWLTEQEALDNIAIDLQRLGIETEELDGEELDAAIAELVADKPVVQVKVKRTKGADGADYVNTRILKVMDEEEGEGEEEDDDDVEGDDDGEEAPEKEDEEDEETDAPDDDDEEVEEDDDDDDVEEADEEDEDGDDDEDSDPPEVDDLVKWKAPKARKMDEFTVTAVNVKAETVTLKRNSDDKSFTKVPWAALEYEYDE